MVKIKQQLVSNPVAIMKGTNGRKHIVIHETANTSRGAGAQAHANLQSNRYKTASWHYQVDDKGVIQSHLDTVKCLHAGDGSRGAGNNNGIAIEICVNPDSNFSKAVDNAVELVKILMVRHNIPLSQVRQHNSFSGKNCPSNLRSGAKGVNWNDFISMVKNNTPSKPNVPANPPVKGKGDMQTTSIVTYLNSIGTDSSFNNRAKLATQYGIKGYAGTASQNTQLLKLMRDNSAPSNSIGVATVKVDKLSLRKSPSVNGQFIRDLRKGEKYIVWKEQNGWLNLGGDQWASWQNGIYMDWKK